MGRRPAYVPSLSPPCGLFGHALQAIRQRHALSQMRLAELAGCDTTHISRLEHGQRQPTRAMVRAISAGCGLERQEADRLLLSAGYVPEVVLRDPALMARVLEAAGSPSLPERGLGVTVQTRSE